MVYYNIYTVYNTKKVIALDNKTLKILMYKPLCFSSLCYPSIYYFTVDLQWSLLTVFPRVTNDNRRLWTQPKVVDSLDFDLIRSEGICIVDVVLQPFSGCILPLLSGIFPFPPHQILQVGPVPLSVGQRLKAWFTATSIGLFHCGRS